MPQPQQKTQNGWNVVGAAPLPAPATGGWDVVGTAPLQTQAHPATQSAPASSLFGPNPVGSAINTAVDSIKTIGSHVAGNISGAFHTVTDAPQGKVESAVDTLPGVLPAYRALVKPTVDALGNAATAAKAGNYGDRSGGYDAQGNYSHPGMADSLLDAVPVAGPFARSIQNDAQKKGLVPALAGAATDLAMGKAVEAVGPVLRGTGKAMQFAAATPEAQSLATTRAIVPGSPGDLLTRALKPGVKYGADPASMFNSTIGPITQQAPINGVSTFAQAADAARDAAYQQHNSVIAPYKAVPNGMSGPAPRPSSIPGVPIADAQMASIPYLDKLEDPARYNPGTPRRTPTVTVPGGDRSPMTMGMNAGARPGSWDGGIVNRTAETAANYRRPFSVPELDQLREDANAKLNAFYGKAGGDQAAALSNPETSRIKAVGDTTRQLLYPFIEQDQAIPAGTLADNQQLYGKLSDVGDIANKRDTVFARQDPVSLAEKVATGHPGGAVSRVLDFAGQRLLRNVTDSDALTRSAADRFLNPNGTKLVARPGILPNLISGTGSLFTGAPNPSPLFMATPPSALRAIPVMPSAQVQWKKAGAR